MGGLAPPTGRKKVIQGGKGVAGPCSWSESSMSGSAVWAIITENVPMVAFWQDRDTPDHH